MNDQATYGEAATDTAMNGMLVGGLAANAILLAVCYCAQALTA